jgi:hypothetical protein
MPKHHKPDYDPPPPHDRPGKPHKVTEREERSAGAKLLLFAGAAIAIVLGGAWWMMR